MALLCVRTLAVSRVRRWTETGVQMSVDSRLFSIPDTGLRMGGLSSSTVYELIKKGHLQKVNIGRRGFVTAESINAYIDQLSGAPSNESDQGIQAGAQGRGGHGLKSTLVGDDARALDCPSGKQEQP